MENFSIDPVTNLISVSNAEEDKLKVAIKKGSPAALQDIHAEIQLSAIRTLSQIKNKLREPNLAAIELVQLAATLNSLQKSVGLVASENETASSGLLLDLVD